jgi:hypothetical protein
MVMPSTLAADCSSSRTVPTRHAELLILCARIGYDP